MPRELVFRRRARRSCAERTTYRGALLGYGATRLLPRRHARSKHDRVRLENMFDPFQPLIDAIAGSAACKRGNSILSRAHCAMSWGCRESSTLRRCGRKAKPACA